MRKQGKSEKNVGEFDQRKAKAGEQMMTLVRGGCPFIAKNGLSLMLDKEKGASDL